MVHSLKVLNFLPVLITSKQLPLTIEQMVKINKNFIMISYMNMWISKGGVSTTNTIRIT